MAFWPVNIRSSRYERAHEGHSASPADADDRGDRADMSFRGLKRQTQVIKITSMFDTSCEPKKKAPDVPGALIVELKLRQLVSCRH
jgi:hypothetical protein